ncbi:hypothetical protein TRVL_05462 [Trypanosoma vivax]|nr:hypothetical protein TRVL_05462 [Trypanosoma vivax]
MAAAHNRINTLTGIAQAHRQSMARNILWLCMSTKLACTANPCFKSTVTALISSSDGTYKRCAKQPDQALAVWEWMEAVCINTMNKKVTTEETTQELDNLVEAAANNLVAKIQERRRTNGTRYVLG